jgi:hypothetical protein
MCADYTTVESFAQPPFPAAISLVPQTSNRVRSVNARTPRPGLPFARVWKELEGVKTCPTISKLNEASSVITKSSLDLSSAVRTNDLVGRIKSRRDSISLP